MPKLLIIDAVTLAVYMLAMRLDYLFTNHVSVNASSIILAYASSSVFECLAVLLIAVSFAVIVKVLKKDNLKDIFPFNIIFMIVLGYVVNLLLRGVLPVDGGIAGPNIKFALTCGISHLILYKTVVS